MSGFLSDRDKDAIWREAKFAADYGVGDLYVVIDEVIARHVGAALHRVPAAWPCDDYEPPLTCYTVPNGPKHLTCGGCREAFPNGPEVQRLYRAALVACVDPSPSDGGSTDPEVRQSSDRTSASSRVPGEESS